MSPTKRSSVYVSLSLLAMVVVFYSKPLLSGGLYTFPWDFNTVQLPLIAFLRDELREGRFGLWNPYNYGGYPVFANIQACFFHPLVLASAFVSSRLAWFNLSTLLEWTVVLQVWIGGVAAYYLFRAVGLGSAPAWTGAVMFETGSYFASRAEHIDSMMAAAWMPLAWLAVWKLREKLRVDWLVVLAATLGMSVWGGFPQATVAVFGSTVIFAVLLTVLRMGRPKAILWTCAGCIVGILLAAAPFIPTTQLTELSVARYRGDYLGTGGGLYWQSLVSLVAPNHFHIFDLEHFSGPWDPTFLYLYSSIGGLLLAIFALLFRRNRSTALFALMLLFGMFWMLGDKTPVWRALFPLLPETIRIGIHPEYTYCIFSLAIAGLAAAGLDHLRVHNGVRWAVAAVIALDLFLVGSGRPMNTALRSAGITDDPLYSRDLGLRLNQNVPPWRFDTVGAGMEWTTSAPILRLTSAAGISPMAPENAIQLRLFLHEGSRWGWNYPLEKLDSPIVDLLNVRYIVAGGGGTGRMAAVTKFRQIASLPGSELFENDQVFPRFFLVHNVLVAGSLAEARSAMEHHGINLRETAVIDEPLTLPAGESNAPDAVSTTKYEPNSIELTAQASRGSLLVLSETNYPGWKAWLDDQPAPIYAADIALRGVIVPAGTHRVRMEFRPAILFLSLGISLITAISLAISAFVYGRRASRIQLN